jgi:hypothetical protein
MWRTRKHPRREIFAAGKIIFNNPLSVIACFVRDISLGGACLELKDPEKIPDSFDLIIGPSERRRPCDVAWRRENRIGVAFK